MTATRVLFILTSHGDLAGLRPTGFYINEAAHPWRLLTEAGYAVDFASVAGGTPPQDGLDASDGDQAAFLADPDVTSQLGNTRTVADLDPGAYGAIFYVGGHGTMFDFPDATEVAEFAASIYDNGGVVAAVCHGPAGLVNIRLGNGSYLVDGKNVTSFTNEEEEAVNLTNVVPFLLEDALKNRGAIHHAAPTFTSNVVADERLVTGQNPQSAADVAQTMVKLLDVR